jgi:hypothetical protein
MNDNQQVTEDFGAFTAPPPEVMAAAIKAKEKAKETASKKSAMPKDAKKAIDETMLQAKAEREAAEKSKLLQKISDYQKHIKEYFPDRVEFIKVPKNVGPKNTVEELRVFVHDLENELGKKGALEVVKGLWVKGFQAFEKLNEGQRFGLNMTGVGVVAQNSVQNRMIPQTGETVVGPAVPTLAEFSIKYASWFSTSVEARMAMMVFEIITGVHQMNTQVAPAAAKATTKEASKQTADLMKDL